MTKYLLIVQRASCKATYEFDNEPDAKEFGRELMSRNAKSSDPITLVSVRQEVTP
jgi:hypothetical protein